MSVSSVLDTVQMWPHWSQRQYQTSVFALIPSKRRSVLAPHAGQDCSVIITAGGRASLANESDADQSGEYLSALVG